MKTVVVLGGAYGGARAATVLAKSIPDDWRIILIDRNTHANHLYVIPRYAVLPGHEHKAFIPYNHLFGKCPNQHLILHTTVTKLDRNSVTISQSFPQFGSPSNTIPFDYCIYALGSLLPAPIDLWGENEDAGEPSVDVLGQDGSSSRRIKRGTKQEGMEWLRRSQKRIKEVDSVLVVGGGALGIQFASDIKNVYPQKHVTLLHSRAQLLPRFDPLMHTEILQSLEDLGVETHLSTRLDMSSLHSKTHVVRTTSGKELKADLLLLCTGQVPNTGLLKEFAPETVDPETGLARVSRTLQLCPIPIPVREEETSLEEGIVHGPSGSGSGSEPADDSISISVEALLADLGLDTPDESISSDSSSSSSSTPTPAPYPNIFVIGDSADAFGAIKAGHAAYFQGEVAARNILRLISNSNSTSSSTSTEHEPDPEELEHYKPGAPAIKVSLGLKQAVYQMNGMIGSKHDGNDDLDAALIWPYFGAEVDGPEGMMR